MDREVIPSYRFQQPAPKAPVEEQSLLGAAFRKENPVVALGEIFDRPAFQPNDAFNLGDAIAADPLVADNYRERFSGVASQDEFDYWAAKVRGELKDRATVEQAGVTGLLAEVLAGIASPTTLVPVIGMAGRAVTAGRLAVAAGSSAAATIAVDEAALRAANITRTDFETATSIGAGAVLGAALGGLSGALTKAARDKAVAEIATIIRDPERKLTAEESADFIKAVDQDGRLNAKPTGTVEFVGGVEGLGRVGRAIGQMSPTVRPSVNVTSKPYGSRVAAAVQQQFSTGGLSVTTRADEDSPLGLLKAVAPGGQLEGVVHSKERRMAGITINLIRTGWLEHEGRPTTGLLRGPTAEATALLSGFRGPKPGKLTFKDWTEELSRALHSGDKSHLPEVEKTAQAIRTQIIQPVTEAAQRVGLLPPELTDDLLKGAESYFMRIYDHDVLSKDPQGFLHMLVEESRAKTLASWEKRLLKLREKNAEDADALKARTMVGEEAAKLREEMGLQLKELSTGPRAVALSNMRELQLQAKKLQEQAKELDAAGRSADGKLLRDDADNLLRQAKQMKVDNPDIDALKKEKRSLQTSMRNLNRGVDKLIGAQAAAMDAADKLTRIAEDDLVRTSTKLQKMLTDLDGLTDENFNKVVDKIAKEVTRLEAQLVKGDETLAKLARRYPELVDAPEEFVRRVQRFKENVFGVERYARGPDGTKQLKIDGELSQKAALDAIEAVLDEGEIKKTSTNFDAGDFLIIHGGSDFDEIDPRFFGSGEPGNIRPLGNGLYGFQLRLGNEDELAKALSLAANYANKYGKGNKTLHIFKGRKADFDVTSNGPQVEDFPLTNKERKEVGKLYDIANSLPRGPERSAAFDAANAASDRLPKPNLRTERLPGGITEVAVLSPEKLQRVGKLPVNAEKKQLLDLLTPRTTFQELTPAMRKSLETWRDEIAALRWSDEASLIKAEAKFDLEIGRQIGRQESFDAKLQQLKIAGTFDRNALRQTAVDALQEAASKVTERTLKRGAKRTALQEKATKLGMEDVPAFFKENERLATAPRERELEFRAAARQAGADDIDLEAGSFDFERSLRDSAEELRSRIMGTHVVTPGVDIAGKLIQGKRSPALVRMLDIPYDKEFTLNGRTVRMSDYLVKDTAKVLRTYTNTMLPDIELAGRFEDTPSLEKWLNPETGLLAKERDADLAKIEDDLDVNGEPLATPRTQEEKRRLSAEVNAEYKDNQVGIRTLIARLKHTDGVPEDPSGMLVRASRAWRSAQVPLYMGGVLISSLPEVMMPVMRFGLRSVFRDSWRPLVADFDTFRAGAREAARAGQGLDDVLNTRMMAYADMYEHNLRTTKFEDLIDFFAQKTGTIALFDYWTKFSKNLAAPAAIGQFMRALETVTTGAEVMPRKLALDTLAQAGVNDELANRLWAQVNTHGAQRTSSGFLMPDTEAWDDLAALDVFRGYLSTVLDITTITPGMERPIWTTASEPARIVNQFRSFGWSANTKMLLAGMQKRDMAVLNAYLGFMALGAISYTAWAAVQGPDSKAWQEMKDADWEKFADEAIYRSGVLAAFGDVQALLSDFDLTHGLVNFSDSGAERLRGRDFRETLLGVSMSTADKIQRVLGGIDDPTQSTTKAMQQLTPYNNVWYLRYLLDQMKSGADEALDIPEDRR